MTTWTCPCGAANDVAMRVCDLCGADRPRRDSDPVNEKAPSGPPAYREFPDRRLTREEIAPEEWEKIRMAWRKELGETVRGGGAMRITGASIGVVVLLFGLTWAVQGNDFFLYKVFAPKYEQVRRETFEQSKAFNQGMVQELQNMQFEYVKAAPEQRDALASVILHRAADYDERQMPPDLRAFVAQLRRERGAAR